METLLDVLHVLSAVFLIGPMAMLPMTALRAVRAGNGPMVELMGKSTRVFSLASLLVAIFGFGVLGMTGDEHGTSVTTGWVLSSIILYLVALALNLGVVVPAMAGAARDLAGGATGKTAQYGRIAAGSGIATLLLLAVVVLMVWKP